MKQGSDFQHLITENRALDIVLPTEAEKAEIHRIIIDELCMGIVSDQSRQIYLEIINRHREEGIDSVILGCTEIGLLLDQSHMDLPAFDTTLIHCEAASEFAFG